MDSVTLEEIIRRYITLSPQPNARGWYSVLCKVCNDHGKKGWRGGFNFSDGKVAYNCFNCGHTASYDPETDDSIPKKMVYVLESFTVPTEEWQQAGFDSLKNRQNGKRKRTPITQKIEPAEIPYPKEFYNLSDAPRNDKWALIARSYLQDRLIDPDSYPFLLCSPTVTDTKMKKWVGRVIIPIFKDKKLIFYQGRDLIPSNNSSKRKKYESPGFSKDRVIYGFDKLFADKNSPLFVVEGWFDSYLINGCSVLGNRISDAQATWLNKSPRQKIYIPDMTGDGSMGATRALRLGWSISIPDIEGCKDITDSYTKYGKLYTLKTLNDNICTGFEAALKLKTLIDRD